MPDVAIKAVYHRETQEFIQAIKEGQEKTLRHVNDSSRMPLSFGITYISPKWSAGEGQGAAAGASQNHSVRRGRCLVSRASAGEYDFSEEKMRDSVGFTVAQILAQAR
jgi:hypothetical protein